MPRPRKVESLRVAPVPGPIPSQWVEINLGAREPPDGTATRWARENPRTWAALVVRDPQRRTTWTYWIFSGRAYREPTEMQQG